MPVAEFFQKPTLAGVAAVVDRLLSEKATYSEDDLLAALAEVEGRSDEEIEQILARVGNDPSGMTNVQCF